MVHEHDHECGCGHHHHDEDTEHLHTNKYQQAFAKFEAAGTTEEVTGRVKTLLGKHGNDNFTPDVLKQIHGFIDLTSLTSIDTKESIWKLVDKVNDFEGTRPDVPNVAAICTYPLFVETVKEALSAQEVKIASVAGGFPSSQTFMEIKIAETAMAVMQGADEIDVVIPIPDSSRPSAMQLAQALGIPFREGFVKNRYVGRTFIMPGQAMRKKSVRQKLNTVGQEFKGKRVLLVDDSIVRGTTSREIVEMARAAGATKVYFASAAPPVRFPNVYGIDMPTRAELIATGRNDDQIAAEIGADALVYQDIEALKQSITTLRNDLTVFDASCFDGCYITGDIDAYYLDAVEGKRGGKPAKGNDDDGDGRSSEQMVLGLSNGGQE